MRLAAARTLGASAPTNEQLVRLAKTMEPASTSVQRLLLPVFAKASDPKVGTALAEALERSPAAEALTVAELDKTLKAYPADVRAKVAVVENKIKSGVIVPPDTVK